MRSFASAFGVLVAAVVVVLSPAQSAGAVGPDYVGVNPVRLEDTRTGAMPTAGSVTKVSVAGNGVPSDASAVWLNVTAVLATGQGHLTVYPCGATRPNTANVNYTTGSVSPNAVLAGVGTNQEVCIWTLAAAHIVVDLNGYVPAGGTPMPIVPVRLDDTRTGTMPTAGSVTKVKVAGVNGVPNDATGVILNVAAVLPAGPGHLTVYPCGATRPNTASVNYEPGTVAPNAVLGAVGTNQEVCIWTYAASHIVVDLMAYVPDGGTPNAIVPARAGDTRAGAMPAAGSVTKVQVAGLNGVPADATSVMLNVAAVAPTGPGHLTVYPCGANKANTANVNYGPTPVSSNAVMSAVGSGGEVCIWTYAATHIVVDVFGSGGTPTPAAGCTISGVAVTTPISQVECDALIAFGNALIDPASTYLKAWLTATDPCGWEGVTCAGGHVTEISLAASLLAGDVPAEIGDLSELTYLGLALSGITSLPPEIGDLDKLEILSLTENMLTALPPEIGDLDSLKILNLFVNELTALPVELGDLTTLEELDVAQNHLGGDITYVFLPLKNNAPNLTTLRMMNNSGCPTTTDPVLEAWLLSLDPDWDVC